MTTLKMTQIQCAVDGCMNEPEKTRKVYWGDVDAMVYLCDYHYGRWQVRSIDPQE